MFRPLIIFGHNCFFLRPWNFVFSIDPVRPRLPFPCRPYSVPGSPLWEVPGGCPQCWGYEKRGLPGENQGSCIQNRGRLPGVLTNVDSRVTCCRGREPVGRHSPCEKTGSHKFSSGYFEEQEKLDQLAGYCRTFFQRDIRVKIKVKPQELDLEEDRVSSKNKNISADESVELPPEVRDVAQNVWIC